VKKQNRKNNKQSKQKVTDKLVMFPLHIWSFGDIMTVETQEE
jgi:hypothetical protein